MLSNDSEWITRAKNGQTIKWSRRKLSLLPRLLVGLAMIAVIVLRISYWLELGENPPENPVFNSSLYYITVVTTLMVIQLGYYRMYKSHYRDMRCDTCQHVFCLVNVGVHSVDHSYNVEQQENNESRYVEFKLGDHVYGGRTEGSRRSRLVTTKTTHFNCCCVICGDEQLHSEETGKEEGDWSEWH